MDCFLRNVCEKQQVKKPKPIYLTGE